jgi:hypothetical protein
MMLRHCPNPGRPILGWLLGLFLAVSGQANAPKSERMPDFNLADQFGEVHRNDYPRAQVGVITIADRKGSEQMPGWVQPLRERYKGRIEISGIAVLGAVPKLFRGRIVREFRNHYDHPVLLDWGGQVVNHLSWVKEEANLYLVDTNGMIIEQWSGAATPTSIEDFLAAIGRALSGGRADRE